MNFKILIIDFQWDGGPLVQIDWSANEELLCIAMDGSVLVYDIHGTYQRTFSMGQVIL